MRTGTRPGSKTFRSGLTGRLPRWRQDANTDGGVVEGTGSDNFANVATPWAVVTSADASVPSDTSGADFTLVGMVAVATLVLFASPTRLFFLPFPYEGDYNTII